MTEKKGFFRRVFSFGQPEEREAGPEQGPTTAAPLPQHTSEPLSPEPIAERRQGSDPDALAEAEAATLISSPPAEESFAGPSTPDVGAAGDILFADDPEWLDPDAPEPEADFSWLEADVPAMDPAEAADDPQPVEMPADAVPRTVEPIIASDASAPPADAPDIVEPRGSFASDGSAVVPVASEGSAPLPSGEPDFSFLEPDAPLPEEDEEEADFSWLEPEAPLPEDRGGDGPEAGVPEAGGPIAAIGAAGIAAAGVSASPSTGEGGWRLREAALPLPATPAPRTTFFERLREGLSRSSNQLSGSITALFTKRRLDDATLQDFEDVLLQADLGVETALRITDRLSEGRFGKEITGDQVRQVLADEVEATLKPVALPLELDLEKKPHVILVVGVNGTGKTTTIGKLAAKLSRGGLKVTLCAGDTFRAAAVEQLKIWGERTGSEVVAKAIGADAAGLAYEAYDRAVENDSDVLIIDTAGRLQNKTELMAELEKIVRVLQKREPDAPHTVLQTLDATTGQNALSQVEIFRNVAGVNGLVMTKLDGTARGGILVAIAAKYRLPVYFIGVGEGIDDLEPFKARDFAMAIAGKE